MRTVLYTSVFGHYDSLGLTVEMAGDVDYVCFTDDASDPDLGAGPPWTVVEEQGLYDHPRMSAKFYKLRPDVLFPEYEVSVYVDGSMHKPNPDLVAWAAGALGDDGLIAAFRHPYHRTAFADAAHSAMLPKYDGVPVMEQVEFYKQLGWDGTPYFATGTLARRHATLSLFGKQWLAECENWTYQDQLSFSYVALTSGVDIHPFDGDQLDNPFISPGGHRRQD